MILQILLLCACLIFLTSAILSVLVCDRPFVESGVIVASRVFAGLSAGVAAIVVVLTIQSLRVGGLP
jgi:hypothetical protein